MKNRPTGPSQRTWCLIADGNTGVAIAFLLSGRAICLDEVKKILLQEILHVVKDTDLDDMLPTLSKTGLLQSREVRWQRGDHLPIPGERTLRVAPSINKMA
jgi:hypothetical protein